MSREEKINEIIDDLIELGLLIIQEPEYTISCDPDVLKSNT